jgi:hypothetical protein
LSNGGIKVIISALVEDTCSLMVANIPVVVTATLRLTREEDQVQTYGSSDLRFNSKLKRTSNTTAALDTTKGNIGTPGTTVVLQTISESVPSSFTKETGDEYFTHADLGNRDQKSSSIV